MRRVFGNWQMDVLYSVDLQRLHPLEFGYDSAKYGVSSSVRSSTYYSVVLRRSQAHFSEQHGPIRPEKRQITEKGDGKETVRCNLTTVLDSRCKRQIWCPLRSLSLSLLQVVFWGSTEVSVGEGEVEGEVEVEDVMFHVLVPDA